MACGSWMHGFIILECASKSLHQIGSRVSLRTFLGNLFADGLGLKVRQYHYAERVVSSRFKGGFDARAVAMGDRLAVRRIASCLRGGEDYLQNARCVPQIGVRWASGGTMNSAREAKAASPSKVVKKGGAAAQDEGLEKREKFDSLLQACLDAPAPVRHLKEKERVRELEREKLGLVSKEKERALERDKIKAKAIAKEKKKSDKSGTDTADAMGVVAPTAQPPAYELTKEKGMGLAKEYSRFLMKEARLRAAAENVRLQLKKDAIAALPPHLREKALVPDFTPFPPTRIPASLTPPIPGYVEEMTRSAEASAKIQKKR